MPAPATLPVGDARWAPIVKASVAGGMTRDGAGHDFTYDGLRRATNRSANVLGRLCVRKGDVVAMLAGRIPGFYIAALGTPPDPACR